MLIITRTHKVWPRQFEVEREVNGRAEALPTTFMVIMYV